MKVFPIRAKKALVNKCLAEFLYENFLALASFLEAYDYDYEKVYEEFFGGLDEVLEVMGLADERIKEELRKKFDLKEADLVYVWDYFDEETREKLIRFLRWKAKKENQKFH